VSRLLTLSRAARLVGVRRGALQGKIRSGELATFEGLVSAEDLLRAYPQAQLEDDGLERFERIKDSAFTQRMRERALPSVAVLVARLSEMSRELAQAQARSEAYRTSFERLSGKLGDIVAGAAPAEPAAGLLAWLQSELSAAVQSGQSPDLLAQDRFMRIMTAHVHMRPSGHEFFVEGSDTLLEAALRAGLAVDYGCSIGSCGKCKARVVSGQVQRTRHSDYALTAAEKNAGVVLMCCNTAVLDLVIEAHEAQGAAEMPLQCIETRVKSVTPLGDGMRLLHLQTPRTRRLRFLAGQSALLGLPDGAVASRPIASCPCDDRNLQFHIARRDGDPFAQRVFDELRGGDAVSVEGPRGTFVLNEISHRSLVFVAVEAGFAPVKSLVEHALSLDAAEAMHLYWIARATGGHYLDNLCRSWSEALDNFRYVPLTAGGELADEELATMVLNRLLEDHPRLEERDVYLVGPEAFSAAAVRGLEAHGLPRAQLAFDALQP
jgi:CDP-4-dehydro-6-deoxyglucose reductase, E3